MSDYQPFRDVLHKRIPEPLDALEIVATERGMALQGAVAGKYFSLLLEGVFAGFADDVNVQRMAGRDVGEHLLHALGRWKMPERPA